MISRRMKDDFQKIRTTAAQALTGIEPDAVTALCKIELAVKLAMRKLPGTFRNAPPIAVGDFKHIDPMLTVADGI